MNPTHRRWLALLSALGLALAACAGPVGTVRVDPKVVQADLGRSATTTGEPSWPTRNVLFERGLFDAFADEPEAALAELHQAMVAAAGDPDLLFALAELSYIHGRAAAEAGLHARGRSSTPTPSSSPKAPARPRAGSTPGSGSRRTCTTGPSPRASPPPTGWRSSRRAVPLRCPSGGSRWPSIPAALRAGDRELYRFIPIAELEVHGLAMRYRWSGLGAPLAASTRPLESAPPGRDMVAPRLQVPVTALLRLAEARRALVQGEPLAGRLELHLAWDAEAVAIAGEQVPLENEPTAAMALTLTDVPVFEIETFGFLGRLTGLMAERPPLVSTTPYKPGLIPVVFVHGTASSVVRWAEMYNRLLADPEIRQPLPVLVLPVRLRQPHPAVRPPPARGADGGGGAARPRGHGSGAPPDGPDRAQPGGPAGQDAGHPQRRSDLERG